MVDIRFNPPSHPEGPPADNLRGHLSNRLLMDLKPVKMTLEDANGRVVTLHRSGELPDLFVSADGHFVQVDDCLFRSVNNQPTIRYRGEYLSARSTVADAWYPGWRETYSSIVSSERWDMRMEVMQPTKTCYGRPPAGEVVQPRRKAEFYTAFLYCGDTLAIAEGFGASEYDVVVACQEYLCTKRLNLIDWKERSFYELNAPARPVQLAGHQPAGS